MKKWIALAAVLLTFCSCSTEAQISELAFATVIGIDRTGEGLLVSAALVLPHKSENEQTKVMSVSCASLAEGLTKLDAQSPDTVFFGHVTAVLFGENAAREGIADAMDCLVRSAHFRLDLLLIAVRNNTAQAVLEAGAKQSPPPGEALKRLFRGDEQVSCSGAVCLSEATDALEDPLQSMFLPFLVLEKEEASLAGLALFRGDRLLTFLDGSRSLGLNFLADRVKRAVIETEGATVRVNESRTKTDLRDGVFYVRIRVKTEVVESNGRTESFDDATREAYSAAQANAVRSLAQDALTCLRSYGCDAAGFGRCFNRAGGVMPENTSWDEIFARITVRIEAEASWDPDKNAGEPVRARKDDAS